MYEDFYEEHGAMGRAYSYMHEEAKREATEAFKKTHRYIPEKKLEHLVEDLQGQGFYLNADKITVFGEHHPIAEYDGNKWNIEMFPYKEFDKDRFDYCMDLKKVFSKYKIFFQIKDVKEVRKILIKSKKSLDSIVKSLKF